ncbi:MAG: Hsp20/alpha crystallin family protein [Halobacteria archaeon]
MVTEKQGKDKEVAKKSKQIVDKINQLVEEMGVKVEFDFDHDGSGIPVDVIDREDEVLVVASLPGFERDDIRIRGNQNRMILTADKTSSVEEKEGSYFIKERTGKHYERVLELPADVDIDGSDADLSSGVLEINLPKINPQEPSQEIQIN